MSAITAKASRKMKKYAVLTREPRCFLGSFDFSWEQRKLGDLLQTLPFKQFLKEPEPDGKYEIIQQGNEPVIGFANGTPCGDYKDVVIFGDHTLSLYKPQHPFFVATDGVRIVKGQQDTDGYYLLSLLERYKPQSEGYKRYYSILADTNCITTYNTSEQEKIGVFFKLLDNLITLHQRKCVFLFGFFQAFISMIFTASTFSWEQRKVGDLLIERNQQAPMSDEYPLMAFIANEGVAPKGERYDRSALVTDTVNKLYKKTEKGDFIYSSNNLETGSIGLNKYGKACISPVYSIFEPTGIADSDFLGRRLVRKDFINAMVKWRQGVIYGQWRIHESDFLKIEITVPSVEEQRKIGAYLDQLDNLITLHQRECISFTARAGRRILTANKKRNTSSWEQRKLGDIADIVGGGTPSTGNQSYWDGDIDWYAPAEIADQIYANSSQKKITGLGYENSSAKMLPPGTVLFTSRAGIGKTAILTRKGCTNQGFQSIVPHRGELDSYFIFSRTEELKRYGELVGAGSTFVEVSGKQMAVMELMMPPTMREQQTIGGFFQQLDHLITLHQRKGKAAVTGCSNDANNSKGVYCKARDFGYKCCKKVESP